MVGSQQTAVSAQRVTKTIPIVMAGVSNAVGAGFVAGLAKPEGNITGITRLQEEVLQLIGTCTKSCRASDASPLGTKSNWSHVVYRASAQSACATLTS